MCLAFVDAMRLYGVPEEVLTDNGKVFTGRFGKPRPAEVLFERICRKNGIKQLLTKPYSPTTTGKVERLQQTLQRELLDVHGPFESIEACWASAMGGQPGQRSPKPTPSISAPSRGLPRRTVIPMPEVKLDVTDAAELPKMLQFLSEWLGP